MNTKNDRFRFRTIILIFVVAVLLVGGASITGAAAQSSIPGDALYPVKSTIEQTRLSFSRDAGNRAQLRMNFAEQRLDEIASLIEEGRFREVGRAVLAFESDINNAILELENLSEIDPSRASQIALEITSALTRYAQILSVMAANAPDAVKPDVTRALDTAQIAGSLELPSAEVPVTGNENTNDNGNANQNSNLNTNQNTNNNNANVNGDDGNGNSNINTNLNTNDDDGNDNGDDGNFNSNINTNQNTNDSNSNDNENFNANTNTNTNLNTNDSNANDNQNINTNTNTNQNTNNDNGDDSNSNSNLNTNQNTNDDDDNGNKGNSNSNDNDNDDDDDDDNDNDNDNDDY